MRLDSLSKHFESMGARVKFGEVEPPGWWGEPSSLREERSQLRFRRRLPTFTVDISEDKKGQYFDIRIKKDRDIGLQILQALPKQRHLLMMTSRGRRFLCGHDERHWFVAEVNKPVSSVRNAKLALLPFAMQRGAGSIPSSEIDSSDNNIFKRQGEWFFIPVEMEFDDSPVHRNEPIQRRTGSKPHICEQLVRHGGEIVYIVGGGAYNLVEYRSLPSKDRRHAREMTRNPRIHVRGYVRHSDHKTIHLDRWHQVLLNNERVSRNLAFLD